MPSQPTNIAEQLGLEPTGSSTLRMLSKDLDAPAGAEDAPSPGKPPGRGFTVSERPRIEGLPGERGLAGYVWVLLGVALLLRLAIGWLGPLSHPEQAHTDQTQAEQAVASVMLQHQRFARPISAEDAEQLTDAYHMPTDAAEASARIELAALAPAPLLKPAEPAAPDPLAFELDAPVSEPPGPRLVDEVYLSPVMPTLHAAVLHAGLDERALLLMNLVAGLLCVGVAYAVGSAVSGRPGFGLAAAAIFAVHPGAIAAGLTLSATMPLTLAVLACLYGFTRIKGGGLPAACIGGLCGGVGVLIHPAAAVVVVLGAAYRVLVRAPHQTRRFVWGAAAAGVLSAGVVPTLWVMRNHQIGAGYTLGGGSTGDLVWGRAAQLAHPGLVADEAAQRFWSDLHRLDTTPEAQRLRLIDGLEAVDHRTPLLSPTEALQAAETTLRAQPIKVGLSLAAKPLRVLLMHSMKPTSQSMGVPHDDDGLLAGFIHPAAAGVTGSAPQGGLGLVGDAWIGLNAVLGLAACVGLMFAVLRRHYRLAWLSVGLLLLWPAAGPLSAGESFRLVLLPLQGVLALGFLLPARPRVKRGRARRARRTAAVPLPEPEPDAGFTLGPRAIGPLPASTDADAAEHPPLDPRVEKKPRPAPRALCEVVPELGVPDTTEAHPVGRRLTSAPTPTARPVPADGTRPQPARVAGPAASVPTLAQAPAARPTPPVLPAAGVHPPAVVPVLPAAGASVPRLTPRHPPAA